MTTLAHTHTPTLTRTHARARTYTPWFTIPHMLHVYAAPASLNLEYGLMYALQRPHRIGPSPPKSTTGTVESLSPTSASGLISSARGTLHSERREEEMGSWYSVDRMKRGLQFPVSVAMKKEYAGGGSAAPDAALAPSLPLYTYGSVSRL